VAKASSQLLTGTFEVSAGERWCRLHLRRGNPIWAETSSGDEPDRADPAACTAWMEEAIAAPLAWEPSETRFEEHRTLPIEALRQAFSVDVSVRRALWKGVQRHIDLGDLLPSVIDPAGGPLHPTLGLWSAIAEIEIGEPYSQLPDALGSGLTVDELLLEIPDRSGILMKLVWMLEVIELVERPRAARPWPKTDPRGRRPTPRRPKRIAAEPPPPPSAESDKSPADFSWWSGGKPPSKPARAETTPGGAPPSSPRRSTVPSGGGPSSGAAPPREIEALIRKEHNRRMGQDYYTFLGLASKAPGRSVERSCRQLLRRWNVFSRRRDLSPTSKKQIEELLGSLQLVYRTLGRTDRKVEYDRRVDRGSPPVVGAIPAASASVLRETAAASKARGGASSSSLLAAMRAMDASNWDRALAILQTLRRQNPSDSDVLAELGWCAHNHGGAGDAPEEYLLLAITFNPDHRKALEYLASLALEAGEIETVRRRLQKLTKLDPQNRWARRTLRHLPPPRNE
jgi:hypothetical protein